MSGFGAPSSFREGGSHKFTQPYSLTIYPGIRERVASGGARGVAMRRGRIVLARNESGRETRSWHVGIIDGPRQLQIPAERVRHPHLFRGATFRLEQLGVAHEDTDASRPGRCHVQAMSTEEELHSVRCLLGARR